MPIIKWDSLHNDVAQIVKGISFGWSEVFFRLGLEVTELVLLTLSQVDDTRVH